MGLTWGDVDLKARTVRIGAQLSRSGERVALKTRNAGRELDLHARSSPPVVGLGNTLRHRRLRDVLSDAGSCTMRAEGYLMDATLEDGLLTVEGRGRAGRLALDWDMRDRMEALQERMAEEERTAKGQGGFADARTREQLHKALADTRRALADKTTPRIPVAIIDRLEFSDANPVKNGRMTIHVGDKKAIFHFRRKTRDQARELYEELMRQMDTP